jgi:hypothetical protein
MLHFAHENDRARIGTEKCENCRALRRACAFPHHYAAMLLNVITMLEAGMDK